jgi:YbbR domain-containing protein
VTVWGEESFLDSLTEVPTVVTNLNDLKANISRKVALVPKRGVKYDPQEVVLTAEVDEYMTKTVQVPVIGTNFPGGLTLRTFPATAAVTFRVGVKDLKKYEADNFVLTATYEELMALQDSALQLRLRSVPEGVALISIQPEYVQYLIEQTEDE